MNRLDEQLSADRNAFRFDRTDIEPDNIAVPSGEIEYLTRSGEHAKRGAAFNHLTRIKAGRKMDPEIDSSRACDTDARNATVRQNIGYSLATSSIRTTDAV